MKVKTDRTRKEPLRRCISCRQQFVKRDLIRVVRTPEQQLVYDSKGKMSGRGAYICHQHNCLDKAVKQRLFQRHLEVEPSEELVSQLKELTGSAHQTVKPVGPGPSGREDNSRQQPN